MEQVDFIFHYLHYFIKHIVYYERRKCQKKVLNFVSNILLLLDFIIQVSYCKLFVMWS